jgi:broad specificity phosphatase PhoE
MTPTTTTVIRDSTPGGGQTCPSPLLTWNDVDNEYNHNTSIVVLLLVLIAGVAIGILITLVLVTTRTRTTTNTNTSSTNLAMAHAEDCRRRLPDTIILIRHGESEANADKSKWIQIPDNLLGLTNQGRQQAALAGQRVQQILQQQQQQQQDDSTRTSLRVHLVVSPFERSMQTAAALRPAFDHVIVRTDIESRIREQEMGNLQNNADLFQQYRQEQERVGRFWYRFPTGESGSDVLDRVKSWWYESVQSVNTRVGYEPVQAMVVVSHGTYIYVYVYLYTLSLSPSVLSHSNWLFFN